MKRAGPVLFTIIALALTGCGGRIYPVTSGFHAPGETFGFGQTVNGRFTPRKAESLVIWANSVQVEHHLAGVLLSQGYTVVERAQLQRIFEEQKVRLIHSPDNEADMLHVGRIAGATQVLFVEFQRDPSYGREVRAATASVRAVSVETGQVRWSGTARVTSGGFYVIDDTREGQLAELAMRRATCLVESGFVWVEQSDSDYVGGCRQRGR